MYHAIDNTGKIPFEIGLTATQKAALDIQQIASNQPTKVIHNAKEFEEIWADEDED